MARKNTAAATNDIPGPQNVVQRASGTGRARVLPMPERIPGAFDKEPGEYNKKDYEAHGWLDPKWADFPTQKQQLEKQQTQGRLDLGPENNPTDFKRQAKFTDLPFETQNRVRSYVEKRLGVSEADMIKNYGRDLDNAYIRASNRGSNSAEGQDYYTGGPGTDQRRSGELAAHLGMNVSSVHYGRAALSHNTAPEEDIQRTEAVAKALQTDPDTEQFSKGGTYSRGTHTTARNAARVMTQATQGVHPLDVKGETNKGTPARSAIAASDWAVKAPTYGDAQEFPRIADANPVIDRHEYRGAAGIKDFGEDTRADLVAGSHSNKTLRVPHPFEPGQEIDALNLYASHTLRQAGEQRGLPAHVAQPVHWFEQKITSYSSKPRGRYKGVQKPPSESVLNPVQQARVRQPSPGRQGKLF